MNKNILLGVTGGIAAYKMVDVASRLVKEGFSVDIVMTEAATKFVTPLTFQTITHNPANVGLFTSAITYDVKHISLATKADLCLVGPATANFIGKLASGIADDLLTTVIMATKAPVFIAPSMNENMYTNPIFQDNITYLKKKGYHFIEPDEGSLACGTTGKGRLPEPVDIVKKIISSFIIKDLEGKRILITAGPTREGIDPVRFLGNYSTGKMGYAIAKTAASRGAEVTLISGPTTLKIPEVSKFVLVESAMEMYKAVKEHLYLNNIIIMSAAVADYRPLVYQDNKIKKIDREKIILELRTNPDILADIGKNKKNGQVLIGFAVESEHLLENARDKLLRKNLDMIIANDVSAFGSDENEVAILTKDEVFNFEKMKKEKLAELILNKIKEVILINQFA